jgi:hypothetical protein
MSITGSFKQNSAVWSSTGRYLIAIEEEKSQGEIISHYIRVID